MTSLLLSRPEPEKGGCDKTGSKEVTVPFPSVKKPNLKNIRKPQ